MPCCPYARTNPSVPSSARPPATQCIFMRYSEYSSIAAGREGHMGARVAVAGASGYAGGELLRLLTGHPDLEIGPLAANSTARQPVAAAPPRAPARRAPAASPPPPGPPRGHRPRSRLQARRSRRVGEVLPDAVRRP